MVRLFPVFLLAHLPLVGGEAGVGADQPGDVLAGEAGGEAAGDLERGGDPDPGEEGGPHCPLLLLADHQEGVVQLASLALPVLPLKRESDCELGRRYFLVSYLQLPGLLSAGVVLVTVHWVGETSLSQALQRIILAQFYDINLVSEVTLQHHNTTFFFPQRFGHLYLEVRDYWGEKWLVVDHLGVGMVGMVGMVCWRTEI